MNIKQLAAFLLGTQKPLRIGILMQAPRGTHLTIDEREQLDKLAIECPNCGFWVEPDRTIKHQGETICDHCINNIENDN